VPSLSEVVQGRGRTACLGNGGYDVWIARMAEGRGVGTVRACRILLGRYRPICGPTRRRRATCGRSPAQAADWFTAPIGRPISAWIVRGNSG